MQVSFGKQAEAALQYYSALSQKENFYYLINSDEYASVYSYAAYLVNDTLAKTQTALSHTESELPHYLQNFSYSSKKLSIQIEEINKAQLQSIQNKKRTLSTEQLNYILSQYAPINLIDGCWLQHISLAANNHTEITCQLFGIYTNKIGNGQTSKHFGNLFNNLLHSADIHYPAVNTRRFSIEKKIKNSTFTIANFQLALSLFPRKNFAELLGFTLGHFILSPNNVLLSLQKNFEMAGFDTRYCNMYMSTAYKDQAIQTLQTLIDSYLNQIQDKTKRAKHWQRIWTGVCVHHTISQTWSQDLDVAMAQITALTPHQKMLALVSEKAPYARNMHRKQVLGTQSINAWFAQDPFDAEGFLNALAASPYINLNDPNKSLLLTRSINFGGSMFRIFTDKELLIMREWVESLIFDPISAHSNTVLKHKPTATMPATILLEPYDKNHPDLAHYAHCGKRELYYHFVNADLYPDILPTAYKIAKQFFKRAKNEIKQGNLTELLAFFPYSYDRFEARIEKIYQTETNAYEEFVPPSTVPREIMVWFTQQYAPFPLVDGSWVQHIANAGMSHTEISARLFRIYSDEIGNSDTFKNHPNVYRRLLEDEGITMPATDSYEFPQQMELKKFAFDLPLLTLSISMFPKAFLAEIIGVNLAIELSGLGKGYMEIIDELNYWKIDPYFFTLHLTIDNIASGHTALAMETVHIYLDQILTTQGQKAMQSEWQRIWIGYLAFKQNMTQFDSTLEKKASSRFLNEIIHLSEQQGQRKNARDSVIKAG